ncbi:hypothetical protein KEM55_006538, partial [Ascosphaera atra]
IKFCDWALKNTFGTAEELQAARATLELQFKSVNNTVRGIALLHVLVLKSRTSSNVQGGTDIRPHETIQMAVNVTDALKNVSTEADQQLRAFVTRFGKGHPDYILGILKSFIECADLKLDGIPFQAPFRALVLNMLVFTRSIVDNNNIHVKYLEGRMKKNSDEQMMVIEETARRFAQMAGSPLNSIDTAFSGGCVYAASVKVMTAMLDIMKSMKAKLAHKKETEDAATTPSTGGQMSPPMMTELPAFQPWIPCSNGDLFGQDDTGQFDFDWSSAMGTVAGTVPDPNLDFNFDPSYDPSLDPNFVPNFDLNLDLNLDPSINPTQGMGWF